MRLILAMLFTALFIIIGITQGDLRVVQTSEIIAKIEKGEPINYSYVEIKGDLNLSGPDIGTVIESPIKIKDSIVSGTIKLDNIIFNESINFERTKFMCPAIFIRNQFIGPTDFDNSMFNDQAYFYGSWFRGPSQFMFAEFNESANFLGAKFDRGAAFYNSRFNGIANFKSAAFGDEASFWTTIFSKSASFRGAHFKKAKFVGAQFKDDADFSSSQFNESADFSGVEFNKKLFLSDIEFVKLSITWNDMKDALMCNGATYLSLIKNFKDLEQFDDADNCYYHFRDETRKDMPFGWSKFLNYISWLSCGYGVRLHHPILSAILIAILFGIYYESYNLVNAAANHFQRQELNDLYKYDFIRNFRKSLSFSVMMLLSLPPEWSRFGREEYTKFVVRHWFAGIVERLIGWGLMLLLIGVLTRLMVRY